LEEQWKGRHKGSNVGARFHSLKLWYCILDGGALVSGKQWGLIKNADCSLTFQQETMAESIINVFSPVLVGRNE
jgi:hypothetical protein